MARTASEWYASESFWTELFPFMFSEASFNRAAEDVFKIGALTGVSTGDVLDLACGPGRFAIPLALASYNVTGVDRTRFLLDQARERAIRAAAAVEWVEQDMRDFVRPDAFDLVLNVYTSFGYFNHEAENRRVLENVYNSLRPGGVFHFDHIGKELLASRFQPTLSDSLPDGTIRVQRVSAIEDSSRIDSEWIIIKGTRATSYRLRHWLYSAYEIRALLTSVGFAEVTLYGTLDGAAYGPGAQRLIAVARKPTT